MTVFRKPEAPPVRPHHEGPQRTPKEEFDLFGFVRWMAHRWWEENKNKPISGKVVGLFLLITFVLFLGWALSGPSLSEEERQARDAARERAYYDRKVREDEQRNFDRLHDAAKRYEAEQRRGRR
jgi:hypothetical protein